MKIAALQTIVQVTPGGMVVINAGDIGELPEALALARIASGYAEAADATVTTAATAHIVLAPDLPKSDLAHDIANPAVIAPTPEHVAPEAKKRGPKPKAAAIVLAGDAAPIA